MRPIGDEARRVLQGRARLLDRDKLSALSPFLFIIPHPDDEVLGCGGLIAEASDHDLEIAIVYLTDGSASHVGSPTWPPNRLAKVRRHEALCALAILGVQAKEVLFLDWPDADPYPACSGAFSRSVEQVIRWRPSLQPRSIWAPYAGEGHCDHQAALALGRAIRNQWMAPRPKLFEYLVWAWNDPDIDKCLDRRTVWSLRCAHQITRRRRALACHATQLGALIDDAIESFALPRPLTALVDSHSELYVES